MIECKIVAYVICVPTSNSIILNCLQVYYKKSTYVSRTLDQPRFCMGVNYIQKLFSVCEY